MESDSAVAQEFALDDWICPDVNEISVRNNPTLYPAVGGAEFVLVVNTCEKALAIDSKYSLKSYTDSKSCYDAEDETAFDYLVGQLEVRTKVMTQQSRSTPKTFEENDSAPHVFAQRTATDIIAK